MATRLCSKEADYRGRSGRREAELRRRMDARESKTRTLKTPELALEDEGHCNGRGPGTSSAAASRVSERHPVRPFAVSFHLHVCHFDFVAA
jgi:hypothetical protein